MAATRFCDTSWCVSCRVFALGVLEPEAVAVPWYASGCNQENANSDRLLELATEGCFHDAWGVCLLRRQQSGAKAGKQGMRLPCCRCGPNP
jgi:hypothetical protein